MHDQPSLFDTPEKERTPPKEDVNVIRRHLRWVGRIMAEAEYIPWYEADMVRWEQDFPEYAKHLPEEEAKTLVEKFQANIARLRAASKPAA